jgi:dCTP deaminase
MTVLGRQALIDEMNSGTLTVSPILSGDQLGAASIDLRMGNVALVVRARGSSHVDPQTAKVRAESGTKHDIAFERYQKHERYDIPFKSKLLLHPGALALVPTLEWVKLPNNLIGSVTARSTWAREGLSIATATLIEPSYQGIVTLELANLGQIPITLYPGLLIAQITFARVEGKTERPHQSQYHLSFEPSQGELAKKGDFPFIPDPPKASFADVLDNEMRAVRAATGKPIKAIDVVAYAKTQPGSALHTILIAPGLSDADAAAAFDRLERNVLRRSMN